MLWYQKLSERFGPGMSFTNGPIARAVEPPGGSTLITSAPISASSLPESCPSSLQSSMTRRPASGPVAASTKTLVRAATAVRAPTVARASHQDPAGERLVNLVIAQTEHARQHLVVFSPSSGLAERNAPGLALSFGATPSYSQSPISGWGRCCHQSRAAS